MIQRIQTIYLFLTTLLPLLFLKLKLLKFSGNLGTGYYLGFNGLYSTGADQLLTLARPDWMVALFLTGISLISIITIFLFRNRKLQMKLCILTIILSAGLIITEIVWTFQIIREFKVEFVPGFASFIPVAILVLAILAFRGIRKDENLVRSYDRLR